MLDIRRTIEYDGRMTTLKNFLIDEIVYLTGAFNETIRDPVWKDIPFTKPFKNLVMTEAMQKLGRIKQLGPVFHLYPGAVHTRLNHSIGVFHIARLMAIAFLRSELHSLQDKIPFSHSGINAFLCAALLHDLGHFPYAHALKELSLKEHEQLGAQIIEQDASIRHIIEHELGTRVEHVCAIIDENRPSDTAEISFYRSVLSGTLDPDKLDYLCRDAFFCGVPYGVQDVSYIIGHLLFLESGALGIPLQAKASVEHLLFSKYLMYQNVYWHKSTRAATAMAKKAIGMALDANVLTQEDLYGHDDASLFLLSKQNESFAPLRLLNDVKNNHLLEERFAVPYDANNPFMMRCESRQSRQAIELSLFNLLRKIDEQLKPFEVIIDIPEQISFESDIHIVLGEGDAKPFDEVDELFTKPVVRTVSDSLRKLRVFVPGRFDVSFIEAAMFDVMKGYSCGTNDSQ